jgi:hypothetical protein
VLLLSSAKSRQPTLEISLSRSSSSAPCKLLSFDTSPQHHRVLTSELPVISKVTRNRQEGDGVQLITLTALRENEEEMWNEAEKLCGDDFIGREGLFLKGRPTWDEGEVTGQMVFNSDNSKVKEIPEYELLPIKVTGPAENRIDFVFLSDGCESIHDLKT